MAANAEVILDMTPSPEVLESWQASALAEQARTIALGYAAAGFGVLSLLLGLTADSIARSLNRTGRATS